MLLCFHFLYVNLCSIFWKLPVFQIVSTIWQFQFDSSTSKAWGFPFLHVPTTLTIVWICIILLLLLSHFSRVWLCVTPEMAAHQAPQSLEFSRQEHWSGLPFPSPMHESEKWKWRRSVVSDSYLATPWTAAYQAPPSMGFSRQEYWSGVPLPFLIYYPRGVKRSLIVI